MESVSMGFLMSSFVLLYMTSQLAGVIDYNFSSSNGAGKWLLELLQIPALLQNTRIIIESLYWIEEILENADVTENKSVILAHAYEAIWNTHRKHYWFCQKRRTAIFMNCPTLNGSDIFIDVNVLCTMSSEEWSTVRLPRILCEKHISILLAVKSITELCQTVQEYA